MIKNKTIINFDKGALLMFPDFDNEGQLKIKQTPITKIANTSDINKDYFNDSEIVLKFSTLEELSNLQAQLDIVAEKMKEKDGKRDLLLGLEVITGKSIDIMGTLKSQKYCEVELYEGSYYLCSSISTCRFGEADFCGYLKGNCIIVLCMDDSHGIKIPLTEIPLEDISMAVFHPIKFY